MIMIINDTLVLLLFVALSVSSSGIHLENFGPLQVLHQKPHGASRDIDRIVETNKSQFDEKGARLTQDSDSSPPSGFRYERSSRAKEGDDCDVCGSNRCSDLVLPSLSSEISSSVSSSVSSAILSSVADNVTSSMSAAREEGFRDGQSRAGESAQSAISSARARASSVVESVLSAVRSTPSPEETNPSIVDSSNRASHGLIVNTGQLAGIVVGVFFASSISSVLTTLFVLWYRRRKTATRNNTRHLPARERKKMHWPMPGKIRDEFFRSSSAARRRDLPKIFTADGKHEKPSQNRNTIPSANRIPFTSPTSPGSNDDQIFPVSPLSDQPPASPGGHSSPSLGIGLYGDRTHISSESEASDVPPIRLPPIRNSTQPESLQIPVVRMGGNKTNTGDLLTNMWATQTFRSNERSITFTGSHEESNMGTTANRMEEGMMTFTPITEKGSLSPPIIPLRFSSLNAQTLPIQNSVEPHGNDETFLLSTDEESADRDPEFSQDQSGLRSPSPSHSSIISQDLTQFDPGGPQPTSRFSISSAPRSSLGYSASSSSPVPQYHQRRQEQLEINPLRPAPPSPSQLHSPVPRRLHVAVSIASLEPSMHRGS